MSAPRVRTEAAAAGNYPEQRFNQRERKMLQSVANYAQANSITVTLSGDPSTDHVLCWALVQG